MNLSKSQLQININDAISDNSTGQISPYDIRQNLIDITDSINSLIDSTQDLTVANIIASNFSTPDTTSTRAGIESLSKLDLENYISIDNSAFGYGAMRQSYQTSGNVAFGSQSLSCNIYGNYNVGVGFNSLSANIAGAGNVGIGSLALQKNKHGSFNIAIGNAAGYYVDETTNNQLFIASHPIDKSYTCDNPLGSGLIPLMRGDLSAAQLCLGIGTSYLHDRSLGVLQVSGSTSPTLSSTFDLGHNDLRWKDAHISDRVSFGTTSISSNSDGIIFQGNILPSAHKTYDLGKPHILWNHAYLENLNVSGVALLQRLTATEQAHYLTKTIHLASSGTFDTIDGGTVSGLQYGVAFDPELNHPQGYLSDADLAGAGFILRASGSPVTNREFQFTFKPSGDLDSVLVNSIVTLPYLKATDSIHSRSTWNSNISLHMDSGCHIKTPRVTDSGRISITTYDDTFGLYIDSGYAFITNDNVLHPHPAMSGGYGHGSGLAGVGRVNFYADSGNMCDHFITIAAPDSGVTVGHRLLTGVKVKNSGENGKDKLQGFELKYIDDSSKVYSGARTDRLLFSSYDNDSIPTNNFMLLKNNSDGGVFGINNFGEAGKSILPATALNVRTNNDVEVRVTSENTGSVSSALQLFSASNAKNSGVEIMYKNISGVADFNMYKDGVSENFFHVDASGQVGIRSSGELNAPLTVGDSGTPSGVISLFESPINPNSTVDYGKLFVKRKITNNQSQDLMFIDSSGNVFDFVKAKDVSFDGLIFMDDQFNTFGGSGCNSDRGNINVNAQRNTGYGYQVYDKITIATDNTVVGFSGGRKITSGYRNTLIGSQSGPELTTGRGNVNIGYKNAMYYYTLNSIAIGNSLTNQANYGFKVGWSEDNGVLMSGIMGPFDSGKRLSFSKGTTLSLESIDRSGCLDFHPSGMEKVEKNYDRPLEPLNITFTGSGAFHSVMTLMQMSHLAAPMSGLEFAHSFESPSPLRPYASLSGDLQLLGAIRFRDGSSLEDTKRLENIATSGSLTQSSGVSLSGQLYSNVGHIEGVMVDDIPNPDDGSEFTAPTSGIMRVARYDGIPSEKYVFIINRDRYLNITAGDYIVAMKMVTGSPHSPEYRPIWISNKDLACGTCCK